MKTPAICSVFETKRPVSGSLLGFRVKIAIANRAGSAFGKPTCSFKKPYLLAESGDFSDPNDPRIADWTEKTLESMKLRLVELE